MRPALPSIVRSRATASIWNISESLKQSSLLSGFGAGIARRAISTVSRNSRIARWSFSTVSRTISTARETNRNPLAPARQRTRVFPITTTRSASMATTTDTSKFYSFKPLDSTSSLSLPVHSTPLPNPPPHRKRPTLPPLHPTRPRPPHLQLRLQMRLHPSTRRPRETLQRNKIRPRSRLRLRHPRLPLQPIRRPGPRVKRPDPGVLHGQLWRYVPDVGQDGGEWE